MMHTFHYAGGLINYNSDFSGDAIITDNQKNEVHVPAQVILEFVAFSYVARNRISAIEKMEAKELLK